MDYEKQVEKIRLFSSEGHVATSFWAHARRGRARGRVVATAATSAAAAAIGCDGYILDCKYWGDIIYEMPLSVKERIAASQLIAFPDQDLVLNEKVATRN